MNHTIILTEISYRFSTSSGKGGQHVNKVNTKALATFSIAESKGLSDQEKTLLFQNLSKRLNPFKELSITSQQTRSQLRNRQDATEKILAILEQGLFVPKKRKKTKIPRSVKAKIKRQKGLKSDLKASRKKIRPHLLD